MTNKICGNCSLFRPSPYNPDVGNGGCRVMQDWEDKHKARGTHPTDVAIKAIYIELGGRFGEASALLHPKRDSSKCNRFKQHGELDRSPSINCYAG